ncbi:hypothetical protein PAT3040_02893 [Paenibacillus agaridevorans]|uniref:Uncharacterized protein n=1 Tax=Paenibacillus agaridevorans TaxID=171404 RepID=A0A2R5EY89_9BACL|nr:ribbon-helix-helix domain-containing protein [Paenibacillus agaridevorans]GBG08314.1 hypothetical protein PAT3040_02893 [Paenibacillus agaridevorans]
MNLNNNNHENKTKESLDNGVNAPAVKALRGGNRSGAGRKPIGITRKISLTLPEKHWIEIDRRCDRGDYSVSEIIRSILEDYLRDVDQL